MNILKNRKYIISLDLLPFLWPINWYTPARFLKHFKSISRVELLDTSSSAGDWSGLLIQRIGNQNYIIPFNQTNNFPRRGFTLYTEDVWEQTEGDLKEEDINCLIEEFCEESYG